MLLMGGGQRPPPQSGVARCPSLRLRTLGGAAWVTQVTIHLLSASAWVEAGSPSFENACRNGGHRDHAHGQGGRGFSGFGPPDQKLKNTGGLRGGGSLRGGIIGGGGLNGGAHQ